MSEPRFQIFVYDSVTCSPDGIVTYVHEDKNGRTVKHDVVAGLRAEYRRRKTRRYRIAQWFGNVQRNGRDRIARRLAPWLNGYDGWRDESWRP